MGLTRLTTDRRRLQAVETVLARRRAYLLETAGNQVVAESETQLERKVVLLEDQGNRLREKMESQEVVAKRIGIESFELESLKDEIKQMKVVADSLAEEIQKLDIELGAPARVMGHQEAEFRQ